MSHEKGIEAAARKLASRMRCATGDGPYQFKDFDDDAVSDDGREEWRADARAIIDAYLAEAGLIRLDDAVAIAEQFIEPYRGTIDTGSIHRNGVASQIVTLLRALPAAQPTSEVLRPGENRIVRRLMQVLKIEPCRDHSCVQGGSPVKGMGTNGGCRCADNVESAVFDLMQQSQPTSEP